MYIYKTTNLINNKIYVGKCQTKKKDYLGSGVVLNRAIKKYGKENFINEIIEDNINDKKTLNEREIYWIELYHARDKDIGYNISKGGDGYSGSGVDNPMFGKHHTEEEKRRLSEIMSGENAYWWGKKIPEDARKKMSESHKLLLGENHPFYGKRHNQKTKNQISLSLRGKKKLGTSSKYIGISFDSNNKKWRAIIIFNKEKIHLGLFKYEVEAALAYNEALIEFFGYKANDKINRIPKEEIENLWNLE